MAVSDTDQKAAKAIAELLGNIRWEAVAFAHGFIAMLQGTSDDQAARIIYQHGTHTLSRSRELISQARRSGFLANLTPRPRTGSAENPITKLFPATITEQRFLEILDELTGIRPSLTYVDNRESGHDLRDFTLVEGELELPVNIKNAGTRFERAQQLVGLDPDDCVPIPAYKAFAAIETVPSLLYIVSIDYDLIGNLNASLPSILNAQELVVWDLLQKYGGAKLRAAEDSFVFATARKYWDQLKALARRNLFSVISARKGIRVLQTKPKRTPGIGLRAWGTGANAEVNVHVSVNEDMTPWESVSNRIREKGVADIVRAVNRKRVEEVYDPEI